MLYKCTTEKYENKLSDWTTGAWANFAQAVAIV
jgi:hypothetical protein